MSKEGPFEGSLAETPFPVLLFDLWRQERSGCLRLGVPGSERVLFLEKGQVIIAWESLSPREFVAALVRKKVLTEDQAGRAERFSAAQNISPIKSLSELELLSPVPLWSLLESYFVRRTFSLFDRDDVAFVFNSAALPGGSRFGLLQTPDLILRGVRQMHNDALIARALPGEEEPVRVTTPFFFSLLNFDPPERYALQILTEAPSLRRFYERSELGARENRKILFAFACLGILAPADPAPAGRRPTGTPGAEQGRVLQALNEKCSFIFKFVSKEIGPVASTVLNRALDEIKPSLGPLFQKMALQFDGRIEVDAALRLSADHLPEEVFRAIVRGYDEILMAEILAVKKTLGPAQETALVRNLEKVGCV